MISQMNQEWGDEGRMILWLEGRLGISELRRSQLPRVLVLHPSHCVVSSPPDLLTWSWRKIVEIGLGGSSVVCRYGSTELWDGYVPASQGQPS